MKKTLILGGAAALALLTAGGVAIAQQAPAPQARHARADVDIDGRISQAEFVQSRVGRLTAMDANRDGTVTPEEARAGRDAQRAERRVAMFDRLDADKDGSISRAEFEARPERGPRGPEQAGERRGPRAHAGGHFGRGPGRGHGGERGQRGPVVIAEAQAKATEAFTRMDADHDGFVTQAERQAARAQMREHRQERRAERMARRQGQPSPQAPVSE